VIATNPAHSWIHRGKLREILDKLEFLVVQDMYTTTETAAHADLLLPAAGWGEKDGTFINSERRIGRIRKVSAAPGLALADFSILRLVAEHWGCGELFRKWSAPEDAFGFMQALSEGQPCDITGIEGYAMLDKCGGVQWPCSNAEEELPTQERRLFGDGRFFTPDGKARFVFEEPRDVPEPVSEAYPLVLLTGRGTSSQWHTQTRTAKSDVLRKLYPADLYVEIHPDDASARGIAPQDRVVVRSRRGEVTARAYLTAGVRPGQVFLPMHYPGVNDLTKAVFDPYSKQPSYKHCAVEVAKSLEEARGKRAVAS
jgi:assimilatory nitrate reductase catalytic subunit